MPVDCVYIVIGRGTMATGVMERGIINTGDAVEIVGMGAEKPDAHDYRCGNVSKFRQQG